MAADDGGSGSGAIVGGAAVGGGGGGGGGRHGRDRIMVLLGSNNLGLAGRNSRNRTLDFGGKQFKIEIGPSIWREEYLRVLIINQHGKMAAIPWYCLLIEQRSMEQES